MEKILNELFQRGNILAIGGPGSGKTSSVVIPNLLQMAGSYVVHDVNGMLHQELAPVFLKKGYQVRILNLYDTEKSDGYNPITYVRKMDDALMVAGYMMGEEEDTDIFFQEAEKRFLAACILCAAYQEDGNRSLSYVLKMLQGGIGRKDTSLSDCLVHAFAKTLDVSIAGELCTVAKQFSEKMLEVMIPFVCSKFAEIADFMQIDTMKLQSLANGKTIIFLLTAPKENPYNFLGPLFIEQSFKELVRRAGDTALKNQVCYVLDEFAQFGKIYHLECMAAVGRKYNISFLVSITTMKQIEMLYPDEGRMIVDLFQNLVYMGSYDRTTVEYMKKLLNSLGTFNEVFLKKTGKERPKTIKDYNLFERIAEKELCSMTENAIIVVGRKYVFRQKIHKII